MNIKRLSFTLLISVSVILSYLFFPVGEQMLEKDLKSQYLKAGNFELTYKNKLFQLDSLNGAPVILYFGYMHCPDVCPVGLAVIRDALNSNSEFDKVKALFVTLDPERDSPEKMQEYAAFFHSNIMGLTGTVDEIKIVSEAYGTFFRKSGNAQSSQSGNENDYTVDHSSYFYVIDQLGNLVRVMDHDTKSTELAEILAQML